MADEVTTTSLNDLQPTIIAEAMFQAEERAVVRGLVKQYAKQDGTGLTINVPKYPAVAAADLTEGTDMANTALASGTAQLTVKEVGVKHMVTDLAARTSSSGVIADAGMVMGRAIAKKIDTDLIGLFDGFSTSIGSAVTAPTVALVNQGIVLLEEQGLEREDMALVLHPRIIHDLTLAITNTFNPNSEWAAGIMSRGFVGLLNGVPVYRSGNITDTSGVSKGAIFHRDAIGMAMQREMSIEPERDASMRATELNATTTYGVGELYDEYGVELHFLSSITA